MTREVNICTPRREIYTGERRFAGDFSSVCDQGIEFWRVCAR